jgi:hypothetical protein
MSALGQKQTFAVQKGLSALPPKADIRFGDKRTGQPFWRRLPAGYVLPFAACLSMR